MAVIDPKDVTNICNKIDGIPDCTQLTAYAQKQAALWMKKMQDNIKAKASATAKKAAPTDLPSVIEWIKVHVEEAKKEYENALAAELEIIAAYTTISAKIAAKASDLSCGSVSMPSLPTP